MTRPCFSKSRRIDCFKCRHFHVTWDQRNPRGCKIYGFKSKLLPSLVVFQASGDICLQFDSKNPQQQIGPKKRMV